jgi:hypothetical protein
MSTTGYIILRQPPPSSPPQTLHIFHSLSLAQARLASYIAQFQAQSYTVTQYNVDESKGLVGYRLHDAQGRSEGSIWIDSAGIEDEKQVEGEKEMLGRDRLIGRAVFGGGQ